ncbi:hypothetical protein SCA6_009146 [Theobroma cacao]
MVNTFITSTVPSWVVGKQIYGFGRRIRATTARRRKTEKKNKKELFYQAPASPSSSSKSKTIFWPLNYLFPDFDFRENVIKSLMLKRN